MCEDLARILAMAQSRIEEEPMVVANPLQVKAIAHARIKTDKIAAGVLARCKQPIFCPRSGCRTPLPSCVGWSPVHFSGDCDRNFVAMGARRDFKRELKQADRRFAQVPTLR